MYNLQLRKPGQWFFRTFKLSGHRYEGSQDKMIMVLANGCTMEWADASKSDARFGKDFIEHMKQLEAKHNEQQLAGAQVPANQRKDSAGVA